MTDIDHRVDWIRNMIHLRLGRRGAVVQTSGGVDSAVTLALCVRALGAPRVCSLFLPDGASDPESLNYAQLAANSAGVSLEVEDMGQRYSLDALYFEVVRKYHPDFDSATQGSSINIDRATMHKLGVPMFLLAIGPRGGEPAATYRLRADDLQVLLSIQNRKQRFRMLTAYEAAERRGYAVVGASNRDELRTGFVVKYGDDAADICAIGDLSKSEVYEWASALDVPRAIIQRTPTTDTFTLKQSQEDYYYGESAEAMLRAVDAGADHGTPRDKNLAAS